VYKIDEAREAIESLLRAASNPLLSEEQAHALVEEAVQNANMAFGGFGWHELVRLAVKQALENQLATMVILELQAMFERQENGLDDVAGNASQDGMVDEV